MLIPLGLGLNLAVLAVHAPNGKGEGGIAEFVTGRVGQLVIYRGRSPTFSMTSLRNARTIRAVIVSYTNLPLRERDTSLRCSGSSMTEYYLIPNLLVRDSRRRHTNKAA